MKKISIALMALAATLAAVSCQKEAGLREQTAGQMTITAVAEQVTTPNLTKAEMAYKYSVLWQENDSICVKDASNAAIFKLVKGAGTTKGTFTGGTVTGDVKAYYPASLVNGEKLVWPAVQQNNQVAPMFCKKNITKETEEFNFKSLGAVMQIVLTTPLKGITLKSISIEDGEKTMSGEFTVKNDSLAVISATDKAGITLDLGDGEAIGETAKYFNIAVPAGEYNDLTLTFTATDGSKCVMKSTTLPEIKRNVVGKLTLCAPQFTGGHLADALAGEFTVADPDGIANSGDETKVHFSQGNLVATIDASGVPTAWKFAAHQYDCLGEDGANRTIGVATGDVDLFGWSTSNNGGTSTTDNYGIKTSTNNSDYSGDFYDWGKAVGDGSTWRTLSKDEWTYLFNNHSKKWATVNGVNGYVIAPDGFEGELADSYENDAELVTAGNLVFLPAAGDRLGSDVNNVGDGGRYWSSSAYNENLAYGVYFYSSDVSPDDLGTRRNGYSVRLITECSVDHLPFVAVESVSLDKTELSLEVGATETLTATIHPDNATKKDVIWTSSDPAVATVDEEGTVTAVAEGTATITAIVDGLFTATCIVTVKDLPEGALSGKFSVSNDGGTTIKKVHFSQGNLYWDGSAFKFEANQYSGISYANNHVSHFYWSKNASVAYAEGYNDGSASGSDVFFTNETETTSKDGFTVNVGGTEQTGWRTLSKKEWQYLFNTRTMTNGKERYTLNITYGEKMGLVLYPDDYDNDPISGSVETMPEGVVFLPATGRRYGSDVYSVGDNGSYLSSTAFGEVSAYRVYFEGGSVNPGSSVGRNLGFSVRLITESN